MLTADNFQKTLTKKEAQILKILIKFTLICVMVLLPLLFMIEILAISGVYKDVTTLYFQLALSSSTTHLGSSTILWYLIHFNGT